MVLVILKVWAKFLQSVDKRYIINLEFMAGGGDCLHRIVDEVIVDHG
jgi:hypothetical protein